MRRALVPLVVIGLVATFMVARQATPAGGAEPERPAPPASAVENAPGVTRTPPPEPAPSAEPSPATEPTPEVRLVPVSGEEPSRVAPAEGESSRVFIYLHGFCSDANGIKEWVSAAQRHGTVIAPHGDLQCEGQPGRFRWGNDIRFIDYRIQRAITSIAKALNRSLDRNTVTLVGYSEGAARAQSLAWLYPSHYPRAVLMSGPQVPAFDKVRHLERLAVLRGEREYRRNYRLSTEYFAKAGVPARFWELPGASHGELGPDALRVLTEVFDFVAR